MQNVKIHSLPKIGQNKDGKVLLPTQFTYSEGREFNINWITKVSTKTGKTHTIPNLKGEEIPAIYPSILPGDKTPGIPVMFPLRPEDYVPEGVNLDTDFTSLKEYLANISDQDPVPDFIARHIIHATENHFSNFETSIDNFLDGLLDIIVILSAKPGNVRIVNLAINHYCRTIVNLGKYHYSNFENAEYSKKRKLIEHIGIVWLSLNEFKSLVKKMGHPSISPKIDRALDFYTTKIVELFPKYFTTEFTENGGNIAQTLNNYALNAGLKLKNRFIQPNKVYNEELYTPEIYNNQFGLDEDDKLNKNQPWGGLYNRNGLVMLEFIRDTNFSEIIDDSVKELHILVKKVLNDIIPNYSPSEVEQKQESKNRISSKLFSDLVNLAVQMASGL